MNIIPQISPWVIRAIRAFVIIVVVSPLAMIGGWFWLKQALSRPQSHNAANKTITIEPGANSNVIIARLHNEGILANEWPARLWLRLFARSQTFKAGDYEFKSPISPLQVINNLVRGSISTREFTIPEGYNQFDIARVMAGLPGLKQPPPSGSEKLLGLFKKTSLIADLDPQARTLEGYLFPDTYEYSASTTREQQVDAMVKRFRQVYTPEMQNRAEALGMTTRQVITLASLIEKEARVDSERELISSVFHRRLKEGMPLACDPTVIYAALLADRYRGKIYKSDLDRDSRYNTYKYAGLPPGPIASPGRRSIEAALNPAETDYLFFVVDATKNDGSHKFSSSSADHVEAVKLLRQQERGQSSQR
ncbi:MAG: endolytic transglycosylase MltG [Acidobacteria bacterium]|nr:endolytic transglycosylase MltG [Acidobacteriota bacterium]MCI0664047.1 endolytic transglycosylase MltG [Acidobacteriota bacterium]